ncbi:hypothetical protein CSPHI_11375 [Corynebacterium sphenisci DSM 44792]|uniref:PadR family transcriptional regulator n=1 Tax=Corynebacterium sphenisci DSM 44792 TaxID=1437874 RepID=A0A1L7D011_9CORY|nr:helix-turn-helix transcriptional regulator [Corynebacterium sphenisci]APT91469.1 hypothetical protein CSPHI_11375 [Corynebacterium sphenisci DSM 44792]
MSVKHALLGLIGERPRAVAQLRRGFEEATRGTWPLNIGQVYQTVRRLERDGLVEPVPDEAAEAEAYRLTEAGRAELAAWWDTAVLRPRDDRDELAMKIAVAETVGGVDVTALIQRQRGAALAELRELVRLKAATPADRGADRLLLERRVFDLEAEARWLDHVENLAAVTDHPKGAQS